MRLDSTRNDVFQKKGFPQIILVMMMMAELDLRCGCGTDTMARGLFSSIRQRNPAGRRENGMGGSGTSDGGNHALEGSGLGVGESEDHLIQGGVVLID